MAKRKRNSTAAAAAEAEPDSPAPARKKRNTAAPSDAEALALLARARDALLQAAPGAAQDAKLQQIARVLGTMADAHAAAATVRLPRTALADSDAVRLLRDAVLAVRKCGVSDAVRGAVQEIQQLVEPQTALKTNGASKKSATSSTAVSVVPPAAAKVGAKGVSGEPGTPPPEYTLEDDQDMPINALDPDTDYGWDYDEFSLLDHLSAFIDDDGSSSSDGASSDYGGADYGPGGGWGDEDDPWSDDEYEEYYSD